MRKNPGLFLFITILVVCGLIGGCGKPTDNSTPTTAVSTKTFGPAGKAVQSFFQNWEFKRYQQMSSQTVHSRSEGVFISRMNNTPVNYRNLQVLSDEQAGNDRQVTLSVEVTSIPSLLAGALINMKYAPPSGNNDGKFDLKLSPKMLGIEEFVTVQQTWRVVCLDDKYLIDLGAGDETSNRYDNVMNYVLDAGGFGDFPTVPSMSEEEKRQLQVTSWLASLCMDMNIPRDQLEPVMKQSVPLFTKADANIQSLLGQVKEIYKQ